MNRDLLYGIIQKHTVKILNGYISHPHLVSEEGIKNIIVKPDLEKDLGIIAAAVVGANSEDRLWFKKSGYPIIF